MSEPNVTPWHDSGDTLAQGGTVHVSETTKFEQFEGKPNARSEKGKPRRSS